MFSSDFFFAVDTCVNNFLFKITLNQYNQYNKQYNKFIHISKFYRITKLGNKYI